VNEKIKKIENSNLPLISGGPDLCIIKYNAELDKIVVDMRQEPIVESEKDQIDVFCKDNDIDNLLIFHNNVAMKNTENYYSFPYLLITTQKYMKRDSQYGKIDLKSKKEKIYNCLNSMEKEHRTIIFDNLKRKGLLNMGFVSYIDRGVILPKKIDPMGKSPIGWDCFNYYVTEKSYFSVVTETQHEYDNPDYDGLHITEKTYKALISQPFIIVGQYGHLKKLREYGFETYSELFDESYDLIKNPRKRLNFIVDEIERLCNMDERKLKEIYKFVLWKVDYNRNIMLNFKDDDYSNLMLEHFSSPFQLFSMYTHQRVQVINEK